MSEPFFISIVTLAGLLRAADRWVWQRAQKRRLRAAEKAGRKSVQVPLEEYARLLVLDSSDAQLDVWRAMQPVRTATPFMGGERARALEGIIENGEDVLEMLRDWGAKAWEDGDDLSSDDVDQAREYLRGRAAANAANDDEIDDLDLTPCGSALWQAGYRDRARERRLL